MGKSKNPTVALIYDFDGTLSPGNMQEFGFIQAVNDGKNEKKAIKDFWEKNKKLSQENDAREILCYMWLMLEEANHKQIPITRDSFRKLGTKIELFDGVKEWFSLINKCGKESGSAYWAAVAVYYTAKTQFIYKINKGIKEVSDNKRINEYMSKEERPIPFKNMIYFGDGATGIADYDFERLLDVHRQKTAPKVTKKSA